MFLNNKKPRDELIEYYTSKEQYTLSDASSRRDARKVYAYIRSHPELELPMYIKAGRKTYKRIDVTTKQERLDYARMVTTHWKSIYFDTVLPLQRALTAEELDEIHFQNLINELSEVMNHE